MGWGRGSELIPSLIFLYTKSTIKSLFFLPYGSKTGKSFLQGENQLKRKRFQVENCKSEKSPNTSYNVPVL